MAYKFQLGNFVASGSIKVEDQFDVQGDTLLSGSIKLGDANSDEIHIKAGQSRLLGDHSYQMTGSSAEAVTFSQGATDYIVVSTAGTGSVIVGKRLDGHAGLAISGSLIKAEAAELNFLDGFADAAYAPAADSVVFFDATDSKLKRESANDFVGSISAGALTASAGILGIKTDDSSIEMDSDHLQVKALGVTNDMLAGSIGAGKLAGSIPNAKLANSAVTLTQGAGMAAMGSVSLGGSVTVAVDGVLADLDTLGAPSNDGEFLVATGAGAFAYEAGATARTSLGLGTGNNVQFTDLTLTGDLVVQGKTTTVDVEVVNTANGVIFEGATADAHELTLKAVDPTADRLVQLADSAGTLVPFAATPAAGVTISASPAELNLLDATAGSSLALDGADAIIIGDSSDGNATKKVLVSDMATFIGSNVTEVVQTLNSNTNLVIANGAQVLLNSSGGAFTVTLPQNNAATEGKIIKFKKINAGANAVTIHRQGSDTIDGTQHSIVLESDFAAVSLISDGNGKWYVM
jgi:hypothetical protein